MISLPTLQKLKGILIVWEKGETFIFKQDSLRKDFKHS
jgi:hypothetical protein